jgi:hypothetical protein
MKKLILASLIACGAYAQGLVTIQSTPPYTAANGALENGSGVISWQNFTTAFGAVVPAGSINFTVASGNFTSPITLYPNVGANPPGTSYTVQYNFSGSPVYTRNWYVPASSTPVAVVSVEFPPSGLVGATAIVSPAQLTQAGATPNQPMCWNGAMWGPGTCGSGGSGPGGAANSIQINSGSGSLAGLASLGTTTTLLHGNVAGPPTFGQVVTGDIASGAVTLTSQVNGVLPVANGGTGTSTSFTLGSVIFAGAGGAFQQDNANFFWNQTAHTLGIGPSTAAFTSSVSGSEIISNNGGVYFLNSSANALLRALTVDSSANSNIRVGSTALPSTTNLLLDVNVGTAVSIFGVTGDVVICPSADANYRLDVQCSGTAGTAHFVGGAGATSVVIQETATQGTTTPLQIQNSSGVAVGLIDYLGEFIGPQHISQNSGNIGSSLNGAVSFGLSFSRFKGINWSSTDLWFGTTDTSFSKVSPGVLGIGTTAVQGDFSGSLILTGLTIAGISGSTQCLQVNAGGLVSGTGAVCGGGGGGGGTVTNTLGPLTAGHLVVGNGGSDEAVLASLGTATTLLHGNVGGNPTFSAVVLTTDVSGILPFANGGLGTNTTFSNHTFYGNNTGAPAAPVATQLTVADLAAGTAGARFTFPGGDLFIGGVNAQTGSSYTFVAADENKLVTFNNSGATAVTLAVATTAGFTAGAEFHMFNIGAGTVTITPTTSTINGASTLVLNQSQGALIVSDGTNYSAWPSAAPTGSGTVTNIATTSPITGGAITTTGTIACPTCVTSAAALTANQLVIGAGSQGSATLGSLGTTTTVYHGNAGGAGTFGAVVLTTDVSGVLPAANLPTGSGAAKGILQGDASTLTVSAGVISCTTALTSQLGCVKPDGTTITIAAGVISSISGSVTAINQLTDAVCVRSSGTLATCSFPSGGTVFADSNYTQVFSSNWTITITTGAAVGTSFYLYWSPASPSTISVNTSAANFNGIACNAGCSLVNTGATTFPPDAKPISILTAGNTTANQWDAFNNCLPTNATGCIDQRGLLSISTTLPGTNLTSSVDAVGRKTLSVDPTSSLTWTGQSSFFNALSTSPIQGVGTAPATCNIGQYYFNTTNTNTYSCTSANTWSLVGGGGGGTTTIAAGTATLSIAALASGACVTTTVAASGVAATDSIIWNPNASIKAVTGYAPSAGGGLSIAAYANSGNVLFDQCNWASGSITPGAVVLNWRIVR